MKFANIFITVQNKTTLNILFDCRQNVAGFTGANTFRLSLIFILMPTVHVSSVNVLLLRP